MKKTKFDMIISILLTIDMVCFICFMLDRGARNILKLGIIIFLISSVCIIIYLIKYMVLKNKPKIVQFDLPYENVSETINEYLINDNFVLSIEEIKESVKINHYKKEYQKNSLFLVSLIKCRELTQEILKIINNSIENQCKKDKHENATYLYSIPIIIVEEVNNCFVKNIDIVVNNNMITVVSGISQKDKKIFIMKKDMRENLIRYHQAKEKLLEILKVGETHNEE